MARRRTAAALTLALGAMWLGEGCAWLALGLLVVAQMRDARRPAPGPRRDALVAGPIAWPLAAALAASFVPLVRPALPLHVQGLVRVGPFVAAFVVAHAARGLHPAQCRRAGQGMLVAALLAVGWGCVSMATGAAPLEHLVRLDAATAGQALVPGSARRVMGGLYYHRLKMAHALIVALGVAHAGWLWPAPTGLGRRSSALACLVALGALVLTYARAALLAAGVGAAVCALAAWRGHSGAVRLRPGPLWVALGVVSVAVAMTPGVRARMQAVGSAQEHQVRAVIWRQAVDIIAQHPLGVGQGQYPSYAAAAYLRSDPLTQSPRTYPHNTWLGLWAEGGPLAALGMTWVWALLVIRCWRALTRTDAACGPAAKRAASAALFMLVSMFCAGLVHDIFFHQVVAMLMLCQLALLLREVPA